MSLTREQSRPHGRSAFNRQRAGWIAGTLLIILLAIGAWAYVRTRPQTAVVSRRDIVASLPLRGEVIAPPGEHAEVPAPYRAPVARVLVTVGANVRRGEVLVELSHPTAQSAYDQAQRALQAAETAYANAKRTYGTEVAQAKQALEAARRAERAARAALQVQVTPLAEGAAVTVRETTPDLETAMQARFNAELALTQAQARLEAALLPYRQQLEAARTAFAEAQAGRKQALIRAPISGTVLALNAQPGTEVGKDAKAPVATIVDLEALQVLARMKPEEAALVKPGLPVTLTLEGLASERFRGRVRSLTTAPPKPLQRSRYVAVVELENPRGLAKPGMEAHLSVETGEAKDVLAVPSDAIRRDRTGRPVVKVLRHGQWQSVVVETGLTDGHYTEVMGGVRAGDTVQVRPDLV